MLALFTADLSRLGFDSKTQKLGLAVSGGGDSMALMHLAHQAGIAARVASVDHGLRPASADEAQKFPKQILIPYFNLMVVGDILKLHLLICVPQIPNKFYKNY